MTRFECGQTSAAYPLYRTNEHVGINGFFCPNCEGGILTEFATESDKWKENREGKTKNASLLSNGDFGSFNEKVINLDHFSISHADAPAGFRFTDRVGIDRAMDPVTVTQINPAFT